MSTIARITILVVLFAALAGGGVALAQSADQPPMAAAADQYNSPMRGQCMDELRKDGAWRASLEKELRVKIHEEEHDLIALNKKHVFMGYSALWIITVVFVAVTWFKHRALKVEVERLQAEIERLTESEAS